MFIVSPCVCGEFALQVTVCLLIIAAAIQDRGEVSPPHIKEEQEEVWSSQEAEQLQGLEEADIIVFTVKSEEDEEKPQSSQLHESQTEEIREDCGGLEPARNSGPEDHLEPGAEDQTEDSSKPKTEDSDAWKETREPSGSKTLKNNKVTGDIKRSTGDKLHSCSECGQRFRHKETLNRHMRIHPGEKPFSCSECGKGFIRKHDLKSHMMIHTGEKPFSCSECDQRFREKRHLQQHMKTHTEEKPFSCSECGKGFRQNGNRQKHMRIHTGEKPFSCTVCKKRFTWKSQVKNHLCVSESSKLQSPQGFRVLVLPRLWRTRTSQELES
uniref:C2H2-type domain-containing protein n=1 Tax=Scophthalmus maximus TaxID=52904 RepID=A0A8D3AVL4_SCOMX